MVRRILPVSSGKGGVGKTTFAVNFALELSRHKPTILIDLDTGTSSVRSALEVPVTKDLYHFWRRGEPLAQCVTTLDSRLDPAGRYRQFGFVAGPKHYLEDLAHLGDNFRRRLAAEIHGLPAEYVVLDLKAGLDHSVVELLPYTNSGLLVFTPGNPAATASAAGLVKAVLFRALRVLLKPGGALLSQSELVPHAARITALLDQTEDVYDDELPNLDAFLLAMAELVGPLPAVDLLGEWLAEFRVHAVLNMWNGVEQSFEGAVVPLLKNLTEQVSVRPRLSQLGWIVFDERVQRGSARGRPVLLEPEKPPQPPPPADKIAAELAALEEALRPSRKSLATERLIALPKTRLPQPEEDALAGQLRALKAMYQTRGSDSVVENFSYLVYRALAMMGADRSPAELGQTSLAPTDQLEAGFLARQRARRA